MMTEFRTVGPYRDGPEMTVPRSGRFHRTMWSAGLPPQACSSVCAGQVGKTGSRNLRVGSKDHNRRIGDGIDWRLETCGVIKAVGPALYA
jgi:hypothetical protein